MSPIVPHGQMILIPLFNPSVSVCVGLWLIFSKTIFAADKRRLAQTERPEA
jgi:hypothetical protein